MNTTKVLRIQHVDDASGPFTSSNPAVRRIVDSTRLPQPLEDKGFSEVAIKRLKDEKASPIKFAFKDEKQMGKFFSPQQLQELKNHGYVAKWVPAKDTWHSGTQVMYTTHEGDTAHQKRLADLKTRTKFKEYTPEEIAAMSKSKIEQKLKKLSKALKSYR
jgi:hypothetical protein